MSEIERIDDTVAAMPLGEQWLSVRMFPKCKGADAYIPTGIAACCDWVVLSDTTPPLLHVIRKKRRNPSTIFLSLRSPFHALEAFYREILPSVESRFVLISGSEDVTIPNQIDARWSRFNTEHRRMIDRIRCDPRVICWFAENLDSRQTGFQPLPTGMVPPPSSPLTDRLSWNGERDPASVLCAHRVRNGSQWAARRAVTEMCRKADAPNCTILEAEVPLTEFKVMLERHAFVLCVEGGGLDPSPKAWTALLHGCIPVVRQSPAADAYVDLPVAFTPAWDERVLDPAWLDSHYARLRPWFRTEAGRDRLRERLTLGYWWNKVVASAPARESGAA